MRIAPLAVMFALGLSGAAFAGPTTKPVTTVNAPAARPVDLQSMMIQRCAADAASAKITDAKTAQRICACTINVQATQLKLGEFWAINSAAISGRDPSTVLAQRRIQPALEQCRAGVKLNLPTGVGAPPIR